MMSMDEICRALKAVERLKHSGSMNVDVGGVVAKAEPGYETSWIGMYVGKAFIVTVEAGGEYVEEGGRSLSSAISSMKSELSNILSRELLKNG